MVTIVVTAVKTTWCNGPPVVHILQRMCQNPWDTEKLKIWFIFTNLNSDPYLQPPIGSVVCVTVAQMPFANLKKEYSRYVTSQARRAEVRHLFDISLDLFETHY